MYICTVYIVCILLVIILADILILSDMSYIKAKMKTDSMISEDLLTKSRNIPNTEQARKPFGFLNNL